MADKKKKASPRSKGTMDRARDSMRSSPQVRQAMAAEDAALDRWQSLRDSGGSSEAIASAHREYTRLARKRAETATARVTAFSKGGLVKKSNCGASMKPTQRVAKRK